MHEAGTAALHAHCVTLEAALDTTGGGPLQAGLGRANATPKRGRRERACTGVPMMKKKCTRGASSRLPS